MNTVHTTGSTEFANIIQTVDYDFYYDTESWYRDILQTPYEIICKDGFAIAIEYYNKLGFKAGFARGGIRFDKTKKKLEDYKDFVLYLKQELKQRKYAYVILEHMQTVNEFTEVLPKITIRKQLEGTGIIHVKENWINKFNSKKRYDMLYAGKKDVTIDIYSSDTKKPDRAEIHTLFALVQKTLQRHNHAYSLPSEDVFARLFDHSKFILAVARQGNDWLAYNISLFNINQTKIERVFAGCSPEGLKLRVPSYLEVKIVEYLHQIGVKTYDLYGLRKGDGYSDFKMSIADEIIEYAQNSILVVNPVMAKIILTGIKIQKARKQ